MGMKTQAIILQNEMKIIHSQGFSIIPTYL